MGSALCEQLDGVVAVTCYRLGARAAISHYVETRTATLQ